MTPGYIKYLHFYRKVLNSVCCVKTRVKASQEFEIELKGHGYRRLKSRKKIFDYWQTLVLVYDWPFCDFLSYLALRAKNV